MGLEDFLKEFSIVQNLRPPENFWAGIIDYILAIWELTKANPIIIVLFAITLVAMFFIVVPRIPIPFLKKLRFLWLPLAVLLSIILFVAISMIAGIVWR